ncbi:MAG: type IV secretory system conjugative DNA transfer family protein [Actinobacteria bacterium]|nr:type IV secretory system conjugative DNA transfer family protein [Actinomycetota bacterium]
MSPRRRAPGPAGGGVELVIVVVVALMVGGSAVVWLAGNIAGLLAGSGTLGGIGPVEAAQVLRRLPAAIDAPARAWPTAVREELPGTTTLLAVLLLATVIVLGVLTIVLWVLLGLQRTRRPQDSAQWATLRDLRELHVDGPQPGRLIVGRHGHRLLAAERYASVMIVAPSQLHKTNGFAIPSVLEWDGPVLATSVKGDLAHDTIAARAQLGETRVFDPTGATGLVTAAWSPVAASSTWEGARRTAARLLELGQNDRGSSDERFWRPAAARYLAPLLFAASHEHLTMGDVLAWIATTDEEQPTALLEQMHSDGVAGARTALQALQQVWEADPRTRSSLLVTAATALDAWQEPSVAAATGGPGAIDAHWLLSGRNTLYLSAPADDQKRLRGLFTAIVAEVVAEAFAQSTRIGRPIDPPLLLCLDEAANVAPLPDLDELASTGPGQGVQLLSVFQNISQIHDRWGRDRAETIVANHRGRLFGAGIGDRATLEYVGAILGDEAIDKVSAHQDHLQLVELGSRTYAHEYRRLAGPNKVREAQPATALLVYGRLKPTWVRLRPWYEDPALTRKVTIATAPAPKLKAAS